MNTMLSHDIGAAITLVSQTNLVGGKPFSYLNTLFFFQSMCMGAGHLSGNALLKILNIVAKLFQCLLRAVSQQTIILVTLI